jgi:mRNA-decapping enzyme subunit 2
MPSNFPSAFNSFKPPHFKVYGAICVNKDGEVALVKGRTSNKWSFPKGHRERGETALDCALRELEEETGLLLNTKYVSSHNLKGGEYFIFAIEDDKTPILCPHDTREISEAAWWPLTSLPLLDSNVDVSIFRTLMKKMTPETSTLDFIDSPRAHRSVATIKYNMANKCIPEAAADCLT